jgi:hypothetical protein
MQTISFANAQKYSEDFLCVDCKQILLNLIMYPNSRSVSEHIAPGFESKASRHINNHGSQMASHNYWGKLHFIHLSSTSAAHWPLHSPYDRHRTMIAPHLSHYINSLPSIHFLHLLSHHPSIISSWSQPQCQRTQSVDRRAPYIQLPLEKALQEFFVALRSSFSRFRDSHPRCRKFCFVENRSSQQAFPEMCVGNETWRVRVRGIVAARIKRGWGF